MNKKILSKVIATILVLVLTFSNAMLLGVYAISGELENQQTSIRNTNIEFDSYFKDEENNKVHTLISDINAEDIKMYITIKISEGNLQNASASLTNSNFKFKEFKDEQGVIQSIDLQNNKINFNNISKDSNITLEIPVEINKQETIDSDYFTKESIVTLSGTYLNNNGKQSEITKDIKVKLQIHGEIKVSIEQTIDKYVPFDITTEKGALLQSTVKVGIENNNLPVKQASINIEVPVINNVKPTSVVVVGKEASYNKEEGKLTIAINNEIQNDKISWPKNGLDTYKIVYIYGENAYTNEEIIAEQKVNTEIEAYNDVGTRGTGRASTGIRRSEKLNDVISNTVEVNTQQLYKGFLYNNSENETAYQTTWKADIGYTNLIENIELSEDGDKYISTNEREEEIFSESGSYYKTTYISKENFERILGLDGYIDIYNGQVKIGTINKDSQFDINNNYVFTYSNPTHKITMKTSKPTQDIKGEVLIIKHDKAIKLSNTYTQEQLKSFTGIKTTLDKAEVRIALTEIETKAELSVDKDVLSTAVSNDVQFTVKFLTNSPQYQLYEDPIVQIKLPSYIENIELKDVNVLFANENEESKWQVAEQKSFKDTEENNIIEVKLTGENQDYDLMAGGVNLFINATLTTQKLIPSQEANIEMICFNKKDNSTATSNATINFESESGVLMTNGISNYNQNEQKISFKNDVQTGLLQMNADAKTATMNMILVNNEKTDIQNAVILGRLPFEGNKTVQTNAELGTTFNAQLQSLIKLNGLNATVYYSENGDASRDLQNADNGWENQITENTKSYLIVFNEAFKQGTTISFNYNIQIPENLGSNESAYSNYAIYYNNQAFEAPVVGVRTPIIITDDNIEEVVRQVEENPETVEETVENTGEDKLEVTLSYSNQNINEPQILPNSEFSYIIDIKNIANEELQEINITDYLPNVLEYTHSHASIKNQANDISDNNMSIDYVENENKIICNIHRFSAGANLRITIDVKAIGYSSNGIVNHVAIIGDGINIYKNSGIIKMKSPADITAKFVRTTSEYIKEGDKIEYTLQVKNNGDTNAIINILDELPESVRFASGYYSINNKQIDLNEVRSQTIEELDILLKANSSINFYITVEAEELEEDVNRLEVNNFIRITGENIDITTEPVTTIIKREVQPTDPTNPTDPSNEEQDKYSIRGKIWIDSNKNGRKEEEEQLLEGIVVKLVNSKNEIEKETKTNSEGKYEFNELTPGKYIAMFEYDSKLYSVTDYRKEGVLDNLNSDAKATTVGGKKVAITDVIQISDSSVNNIDLGLTKNSIFDLKLDKYIDSITVQNDQGTTTNEYTNTNFAKAEIPARQIASSNVILKYSIAVTNEGDVPGYVRQIVDYLPQDLKFSSELNKDWYINTDGSLYSASLANQIINPGETKRLDLILTKKMNENNTGLIINNAEIAESYNEQGIFDYDSTEANKNQNEDDNSTASVIIGVKTGGAVLYLTITIICIGIMAIGIYIINKKVIKGIK